MAAVNWKLLCVCDRESEELELFQPMHPRWIRHLRFSHSAASPALQPVWNSNSLPALSFN